MSASHPRRQNSAGAFKVYFTPGQTWGRFSQEYSKETFVNRWYDLKQMNGEDFLEMWDFLGHFLVENLKMRVWEHFKYTYTSFPANRGDWPAQKYSE